MQTEHIDNVGTYEFHEVFPEYMEDWEEIMKVSEVVVIESEDRNWYVTPLASGLWVAWEDNSPVESHVEVFESRDEAVACQRDGFNEDPDGMKWVAE